MFLAGKGSMSFLSAEMRTARKTALKHSDAKLSRQDRNHAFSSSRSSNDCSNCYMTTTMGTSIDADTTDADLDTDTFAVAGGISGKPVLLLQLPLLLLKMVMRI